MKVIITVGNWKNTIGVTEGWIPNTDWINVRVSPDLRLALRIDEFKPFA